MQKEIFSPHDSSFEGLAQELGRSWSLECNGPPPAISSRKPPSLARETIDIPLLLLQTIILRVFKIRMGKWGGAPNRSANAWKRLDHIQNLQMVDLTSITNDGITMELHMESVRKNIQLLDRAAVGKILGIKFPFFLNSELGRQWGRLGECDQNNQSRHNSNLKAASFEAEGGKLIEHDDDENQYGPWILVPPR
ncbi:hypothetical protein MA16_Dca000512 [Dendrobium catenatum]|uniref:Uncharacterized protein n=1 Tax=Dendrobium catenatum TaxID=906689 RepID=A0A2I0WU28_9ASPA|nr:hypothetical protein MA16_Dca000512 [Dendrobium catenatum]